MINSFKCKYRTNVVRRRIENIEYGEDQAKSITVLDAIKWVGYSWDQTTAQTIQNCYKKAGFKKQVEVIELDDEAEEQPDQEFQDACNELNRRVSVSERVDSNAYLAIDKNLPFAGVSTDEEIISEHMIQQASIEPELESDEEEESPPVTKSEANNALKTLQLYLLQSSDDTVSSLQQLAKLEEKIRKSAMPVQSTITSFFKVIFFFVFLIIRFLCVLSI